MKMAPPPKSVYQRAEELFKLGFSQPAHDVIEVELRQNPDQGRLLVLQAVILHSQRKWAPAMAAAERASVLICLPVEGQMALADCYSLLGKKDLARAGYLHLLEHCLLSRRLYAGLYKGFRRLGDPQMALVTCRKALEQFPDDDQAHYGMAHAMSAIGYPTESITRVLEKCLQLAPDNDSYRMALAVQLKKMDLPVAAYELLTAVDPSALNRARCFHMVSALLDICTVAGDSARCAVLEPLLSKARKSGLGRVAVKRESDSER
jgi:tetratricopeptide (TPR) repeat protein